MEIDDLTPAERRVWRAFAIGEEVNFRTGRAEWGPARTVRARVLRSVLLGGPRQPGETAALRLRGARITGPLDLRNACVESVVHLTHCRFEDAVDLDGAQLRYFSLRDSELPRLSATRARFDGNLRLTRCRVGGPVRVDGARIGGLLLLDGAVLTPGDTSEPALRLNHLAVDDDLYAPGLSAGGQVRLDGAHVAGSVDLTGARLEGAGATALHAQPLAVEGDLLLRESRVAGRIDLRGARVTGRLDLSYAELSHPGQTALRASSATIGELWLRGGPPVRGTLNLRRSQIDVLFLDPGMLPAEVLVNSLVYTSLTPHEPAERRLPMLERDGDGYVPHAYEQLTAAYRRIGDDHGARVVQLAKQRRHRRTLPWYGRVWGAVQDVTVGYGFRPLRAAGWLLSLLAIGSAAFALHHPPPLKADEAPPFSPVFYTLDLLLPVISFGQDASFAPRGGYQVLAHVLVLTGWILATTVIAGITRTVSRQ
ncbi:hypothetical protein GCM10010503_56260 [Streptomyces lucensis JCM 4490]|uniref:Membrane-associated oxidoreductase n=1 Tax=Streptomyces lucensis JCM 4490 TaxID=1306176 RepID=A0A918JB49_9ACTN|nr:pentapeptide repeat-containing protein [Streptomyces lucensis]GGW71736.1 hypothetical protein GCM10010503_56260 [Streptomyces lucensis JCM 4490]